jgi:phage gpG-like protein
VADIEFRFDGVPRTRKFFDKVKGLQHRLLVNLTLAGSEIMQRDMLGGQILKRRTGRLANSIHGITYRNENRDEVGVVGSGVGIGARVKYADIHITGGVIKAKAGRWLTIPLPPALTPAGNLRGNAFGARDFKNTFFYRSRKGNLLLARRSGNRIENLFVLKKSVKIPKRDYVTATMDKLATKQTAIFQKSYREVTQ